MRDRNEMLEGREMKMMLEEADQDRDARLDNRVVWDGLAGYRGGGGGHG